jgi:hypothetical protein
MTEGCGRMNQRDDGEVWGLWKSSGANKIVNLGVLFAMPHDRSALKQLVTSKSQKSLVTVQDLAGLKFGRC